MVDTAQPIVAAETDPNAQLDGAADAFKAFLDPTSTRPRDESGRFASQATEETAETAEDDDEAGEPAEIEEIDGEADEADDEAADEAQPLPPSWPADKAEAWGTLPADVQAFIAERDAEQLRATNAKMQESANARKAAELAAKEAQTRRNDYLAALETVEALYKRPEPDPRAFGYGTQQYNEAAYLTAHRQWQQDAQVLAQLDEQRETIRKQAADEEASAFSEWRQQHEAEYWPKFTADVPELKEADKAAPLLHGLVEFAVANGIPSENFDEENRDAITSAQLHILWKAQQYDKLRATKAAPKPKPQAGPAVKPGVSSPRSATKAARFQKANERLAREGSIEAGAAVFKQLFKG